ncbi:MAG: hypothetical protein CSA35_02470 [Dethiosulfovibrio peptidovorans]|nr:MAG: hypothetical protein CSA35_02470 [Dethiosulfovibrio peptidovorans]
MDELHRNNARALVTACVELQGIHELLENEELPSFFVAVPGERNPLLVVLSVDPANNKVGVSLHRGFMSLFNSGTLQLRDNLHFFTCTIGSWDSLPADAIEWYQSIECQPTEGLCPEPLVYDNVIQDFRMPDNDEVLAMLYAIRGIIEICRKGIHQEGLFDEQRQIMLFVSGTPDYPLLGVGQLVGKSDGQGEVSPLPRLSEAVKDLPVLGGRWTVVARSKIDSDGNCQSALVVQMDGAKGPCLIVPIEGKSLCAQWDALEKLFLSGPEGEPGLPAIIEICNATLLSTAETLLGERVVVISGEESDAMMSTFQKRGVT